MKDEHSADKEIKSSPKSPMRTKPWKLKIIGFER
jgi:hypothetical protein